jgi:hypothetical protein
VFKKTYQVDINFPVGTYDAGLSFALLFLFLLRSH